jgi:hypothetical protein
MTIKELIDTLTELFMNDEFWESVELGIEEIEEDNTVPYERLTPRHTST